MDRAAPGRVSAQVQASVRRGIAPPKTSRQRRMASKIAPAFRVEAGNGPIRRCNWRTLPPGMALLVRPKPGGGTRKLEIPEVVVRWVAKLNQALDVVRTSLARRMVRDGCWPLLRNKRCCLLKRPENLEQQAAMQSVRVAGLQRQASAELSTPGANGRCVRASSQSSASPATCARTPLPLKHCRAKKQLSSGVIARQNNKAKFIPRKADGYRSFQIAQLTRHHVLGRLPEPQIAHSFF